MRTSLLAALGEVDRLVLLGDALELRHGPIRDALGAARGFFEEVGEALGARPVVLVPGNHDHRLIAPWLERRRLAGPGRPLELEASIEPVDEPAATLARWLAPAELSLAYPGVWVGAGTYATHGHYLDRHITVPTFERLAAGAMGKVVGPAPARAATPDHYEAALAPIYAWLHAVAQAAPAGSVARGSGASAAMWRSIASGGARRPVGARLAGLGVRAALAALNRAGLGPLSADLSGRELRRAGLAAMGAVLDALGIEAQHVVFGHTHRAGPLAGDEGGEWVTPAGTRLLNTGSWVYEPVFITTTPNQSPYWPGGAAVVQDGGAPRLERLLGDRAHAELAPPTAAVPA